ncbi:MULTISPECIES: hypothetical protein [unclassified Neisseria]|uniref:hypothetical protein n=1 Tax=unclassified Neisseria TaxID=2623750 RepID=UPI0014313BC9|nr:MULTISPECIES: hypothetical protein [unclassified Neisseria]MBF0804373.1 hypothetical protein [Neisseria sp. 19428wB4_WF04]
MNISDGLMSFAKVSGRLKAGHLKRKGRLKKTATQNSIAAVFRRPFARCRE